MTMQTMNNNTLLNFEITQIIPTSDTLKLMVQNVLGNIWGSLDEPLLDQFMHQLEWSQLACGDCLYQQNDAGDCKHILVSGRLKVIKETEKGMRTLGEISAGECVGEMSLLADAPRSANIYALRESILAKITREQF